MEITVGKYGKSLEDQKAQATNAPGRSAAIVEPLPVDPLVWDHWHARDGYWKIDLQRYRDGDAERGFTGRPRLIQELAPEFRSRTFGKYFATVRTRLGQLTHFFRYLTEAERDLGRDIQSCLDLDSADGEGFRRYLLALPGTDLKAKGRTLYFAEAMAVSVRRRSAESGEFEDAALFWPTIEVGRDVTEHRDVEPRALKTVYTAAKRAFDASLADQAKGAKALQTGTDPRTTGQTGIRGRGQGSGQRGRMRNLAWYGWRNLTVLNADRIAKRILSGKGIAEQDQSRQDNSLHQLSARARSMGLPHVTAWGLHCFLAPSTADTMAAYGLVSLHTGWMDTAREICVVDEAFEECDGWYSDRTGQLIQGQDKRGTVTILVSQTVAGEEGRSASGDGSAEDDEDEIEIKALRPKTGRLHVALSLKNSKYQPFSVIKAQIERTRFLRDLLRQRRADLLALSEQTTAIRAEIAAIERKLRSPWLYYNQNGKGHKAVGLLGVSRAVSDLFNVTLKPLAVAEAGRRGDPDLAKAIEALQHGDIRDGYAAFVYASSGGNIFAVQQGLNHRSSATTRYYLRQRRQIRESFRSFRIMVRALFAEIQAGRPVDPTILALAVSPQGLSQEKREILARFRSRYGMSCANPWSPPKEIAPNHIPGTFCAVQRCTLCRYGRLTPDALGPLAIRYAELLELRTVIPASRFLTSSFVAEFEGIGIVREEAYPELLAEFDRNTKAHRAALQRNEAMIFDAMPLGTIAAEFNAQFTANPAAHAGIAG